MLLWEKIYIKLYVCSTLSLRKMDEPNSLKLVKEMSVEGAKQIEKEEVGAVIIS